MKLSLKAGTTSKSVAIFIQNNSVTTGAGLTGLVYNTSSLTAYYLREGGTATSITLATLAAANSAFSSGGFKEIDATNMPGLYRLDIPDAAIAASAKWVIIMLKGATNMAPVVLEIELTAWDNQDTVRGGLTALPNAAAEAAGGLYTRGTGAGQINQPANGMIDGNVVRNAGTAITAAAGIQEVKVASIAANAIDASAIATDAIGALELAAGAASEIASAVRTELATELGRVDAAVSTRLAGASYTAPLDAAGTRSAVGLAAANLDTQLAAIAGYIDTEVGAIYSRLGAPAGASIAADIAAVKSDTAAILTDTGTTLDGKIDTIDGIVDAIKAKSDLIPGDMDGLSLTEMLTLIGASLLGKLAGAATATVTIRAADDSKDRITATVDADGNRTAVTLDPS